MIFLSVSLSCHLIIFLFMRYLSSYRKQFLDYFAYADRVCFILSPTWYKPCLSIIDLTICIETIGPRLFYQIISIVAMN